MSTLLKPFAVIVLLLLIATGCAHAPGGIAPSTTPLDGKEYVNLGYAKGSKSLIYLLGILPVSKANTIRAAIADAVNSRGGDAMINVTVESYRQYWILFSRVATQVEGDVIKFQAPKREVKTVEEVKEVDGVKEVEEVEEVIEE